MRFSFTNGSFVIDNHKGFNATELKMMDNFGINATSGLSGKKKVGVILTSIGGAILLASIPMVATADSYSFSCVNNYCEGDPKGGFWRSDDGHWSGYDDSRSNTLG